MLKRIIFAVLVALLAAVQVQAAGNVVCSSATLFTCGSLPAGWSAVGPQLQAADGSNATPAFIGSDADTGFYFNPNLGSARAIGFAIDGLQKYTFRTGFLDMHDTAHIRWDSTTSASASPDVGIARGAAGQLNITDGSTVKYVTLWSFGASLQSADQLSWSSSATDSSTSNDAGIKRLGAGSVGISDGGAGGGSLTIPVKLIFGDGATATVDAATTFTVVSSNMILACTGAETINTATGGVTRMILVLLNNDTDCTITDDDTPTASNAFNLTGTATNDVGAVGKYMIFVFDGNAWQQVSESANN